jgi:hypothetical protein
VKILSSVILSLIFLVFWSCSDAGKDPLSSGDETDCTQELDCNSICGGVAINDACGVCDGNGSTCNISYSQIQEIFNSKCIGCHNGGHSSGLDLRTYAGVTDGGNGGAVIIPYDHTANVIYDRITREESAAGDMPPTGSLSQSQIDLIAQWIDEGALEEPQDN